MNHLVEENEMLEQTDLGFTDPLVGAHQDFGISTVSIRISSVSFRILLKLVRTHKRNNFKSELMPTV